MSCLALASAFSQWSLPLITLFKKNKKSFQRLCSIFEALFQFWKEKAWPVQSTAGPLVCRGPGDRLHPGGAGRAQVAVLAVTLSSSGAALEKALCSPKRQHSKHLLHGIGWGGAGKRKCEDKWGYLKAEKKIQCSEQHSLTQTRYKFSLLLISCLGKNPLIKK